MKASELKQVRHHFTQTHARSHRRRHLTQTHAVIGLRETIALHVQAALAIKGRIGGIG